MCPLPERHRGLPAHGHKEGGGQATQVWRREGVQGLNLALCHEDADRAVSRAAAPASRAVELARYAADFGPLNVFCIVIGPRKWSNGGPPGRPPVAAPGRVAWRA